MGDLSTSRRVVIGALAVVLALLPAAHAGPGEELTCAACFLIDDTGRVLFARAARAQRPNASTTKMITALVVRAEAGLDEVVTVSPAAAATGGGGLSLAGGDLYSVHALLHALLMTSSNDAAVALAEHVAGDERSFVVLMNRMASRLGAYDTHSVTAHGLDMPGHVSTARDLALIAEALLADPVLARIVATSETLVPGPDGEVLLENRNVLLDRYPGTTGVKTGYTAGSGDVLVASAQRGERALIAVAMGSENAAVDARRLLEHGWKALARTPLLEEGASVATLVFDPSGATRVTAAEGVVGPADPDSLEIVFEPGQVVPPIAAGQEVGEVVVRTAAGSVVGRVPALAAQPVQPAEASWAEELLASVLRTAGSVFGW